MRFLFRLIFWMGIVLYYLPADETRVSTAQANATVASKSVPRSFAEKRQSCAQDTRCASKTNSQNTLKLSDLEPTWRRVKDSIDLWLTK